MGKLLGQRAHPETLHFGVQQISTTTTPRYLSPGGDSSGVAAAGAIGMHVGRSGYITAIRAKHQTAGTGAATITYTVEVNGVDALAVAVSNTSTTVAVATGRVYAPKGAYVSVRVDKSASIAASPLYCNADVTFE